MIKFDRTKYSLVLIYVPTNSEPDWVTLRLEEKREVTIRKAFSLKPKHLIDDYREGEPDNEELFDIIERYEYESAFKIGSIEGSYYKLDREILGLDYDLFISDEINLEAKYFIAHREISIFRKLNNLIEHELYIGGDKDGALPESTYMELISKFPNTTEVNKYAHARISAILRSDLDLGSKPEESYQSYLNKYKKSSSVPNRVSAEFLPFEVEKYESLLDRLTGMLNSKIAYTEHQWQLEILEIIQLLYPKYVYVFREAPIRDSLQKKWRSIDFLLLDVEGNIDLIEIKKPFTHRIVSKNVYRDNYIPLKDLSGSIMQLEKYIYNLSRSGELGEQKLMEKYKTALPDGFEIKITNPKGLIILGRSNELTPEQKRDFEVIKRKYNNVIDILTYDDLLKRIETMISFIKRQMSGSASPA